ncbi:MAG TPA: DUF2520 domain-containing protein [Terriglobales bacterium]|nr:DUF2520 domain-containing protein [Terriglobales bacterium]
MNRESSFRETRHGTEHLPLCYPPAVNRKSFLVVGNGRLGSALAHGLRAAGHKVSKIASRSSPRPRKVSADVVWFCVPDSQIVEAAASFSSFNLRGRYAFHSSGTITSEALHPLRVAGASVASVHPLMTFVKGSVPNLADVPFAMEGDDSAIRLARTIIRDLDGRPVVIKPRNKVAYHAFATMICPLLVSLLATAEKAATLAGMSEREARRRMMPIIRQTLRNYEKLGPAAAFSGPIVRGDVETVRAHLQTLGPQPNTRAVYLALARAALESLPSANPRGLTGILNNPRPTQRQLRTLAITSYDFRTKTRRNGIRTNRVRRPPVHQP